MYRIGIMRGREESFPEAVMAYINSKKGFKCEWVQVGGTSMGEVNPFNVIIDRISHEVPYYQVYLKQASMMGTYVVNNPFWMNADDKFFGYSLARKLGIPVPKTVVLPNRQYIDDINEKSLRNMWPIDWKARLEEVGLPCIMKPAFGGGWKSVHKIETIEDAIEERMAEVWLRPTGAGVGRVADDPGAIESYIAHLVASLGPDASLQGLKVVVDRVFPLSEAEGAHRYIESRQAFGRVLLGV